jgi:uncharacterized cupredoxin-like copper-binding protein
VFAAPQKHLLGLALIAALAAAGCGSSGSKTAAPASPSTAPPSSAAPTTATTVAAPAVTTVAVTEKDFSITPSMTDAPGGLIDFTVTNNGPADHEFVIFQGDMAPDQLPLGADGRIDESSDKITKVVDSGANIPVGQTKTFHAALVPGSYVMVCNLPGHYKAGMHTAFTIKPAVVPVTTVSVTEKDFNVSPSVTTVKGGLVDFTVNNSGPSEHELVIFKADTAPDQLPLGPDGRIDEGSDKISKVFDSGSNVAVGGTKTFHAALVPGTYVMVCNLPGHYKAGMHTAFTVG